MRIFANGRWPAHRVRLSPPPEVGFWQISDFSQTGAVPSPPMGELADSILSGWTCSTGNEGVLVGFDLWPFRSYRAVPATGRSAHAAKERESQSCGTFDPFYRDKVRRLMRARIWLGILIGSTIGDHSRSVGSRLLFLLFRVAQRHRRARWVMASLQDALEPVPGIGSLPMSELLFSGERHMEARQYSTAGVVAWQKRRNRRGSRVFILGR